MREQTPVAAVRADPAIGVEAPAAAPAAAAPAAAADAVVHLSTAAKTTTTTTAATSTKGLAPPPPPAPQPHHPPPPPPLPPPPRPACLAPSDVFAAIARHGHLKAQFSTAKLLVLGAIAGAYVGFGFSLCLLVGGNVPASWLKDAPGLQSLVFGAVGFPFAFTCIVVCGAELFTSMCAYTAAAMLEGSGVEGGGEGGGEGSSGGGGGGSGSGGGRRLRMRPAQAARLLVLSWLANFAGCALFVGLALAGGLFDPSSPGGPPRGLHARALAHKKAASVPWGVVFARAALANALVALATWMANAAADLPGKAAGIWLAISAFAMFGVEHSIANMFLLPMGVALGEPISAREIAWGNLVPSTLGNWVGGAGVAAAYALAYGSLGKKVHAWWDAIEAAVVKGVVSVVVAVSRGRRRQQRAEGR